MANRKRRRLFVDRAIQGALVIRVLMYWVLCVSIIGLGIYCVNKTANRTIDNQAVINQTLVQFGPALIAAVLMLPVIIYDTIRISNRFAGPVLRLRRAWRNLAQGELGDPVKFREKDFWQDLADEYNQVRLLVQSLQQSVAEVRDDEPREETSAVY